MDTKDKAEQEEPWNNNDKIEKEQPWKKLFAPQAVAMPSSEPDSTATGSPSGTEPGSPATRGTEDKQAGNSPSTSPWKNWKPMADAPDEKPWYQWMNDAATNPNLGKENTALSDEERGRGMQHPTRKRSKSSGTIAEGG